MSIFKVNDMSCGHCEKAIKAELAKENPAAKVEVNLKDKTVTVDSVSDERVIYLLEEIGYTPEKMK
ncbi:heavy-metal-associated domain-containing protein [Peredibacter sp. HCB2-198]|uniref:heavy-metal-associated domain-containing protein n=1 Tax=Peredibacter sp. HCB2-198 TaxID=3383025 RepID=UPI0038B44CCB